MSIQRPAAAVLIGVLLPIVAMPNRADVLRRVRAKQLLGRQGS